MAPANALKLLDDAIADLEAKLNLQPGEDRTKLLATKQQPTNDGASKQPIKQDTTATDKKPNDKGTKGAASNNNKKKKGNESKSEKSTATTDQQQQQADICKLEFKVGQIVKVWVHPEADKLYCEEIDVGEALPRKIASGLRPHFTEEQMLGQRLLVVSNLKAKNLVGFKSHGMVLCAAKPDGDGGEIVEFVEPPEGAPIGEVVTFEGLPPPQPCTPAQVEKKKIWQAASSGMQTTDDCCAAWKGHVFMTKAGPCRTKTIAVGPMR